VIRSGKRAFFRRERSVAPGKVDFFSGFTPTATVSRSKDAPLLESSTSAHHTGMPWQKRRLVRTACDSPLGKGASRAGRILWETNDPPGPGQCVGYSPVCLGFQTVRTWPRSPSNSTFVILSNGMPILVNQATAASCLELPSRRRLYLRRGSQSAEQRPAGQ
jgi:hypothetical protein